MLFQGYWDDSEDTASRYFGVGGFVGGKDSWTDLEPNWLAALPEGIDYFHATDCFSGNNQFEPSKGFGIQKRVALLNKLTDLICDTDIKLICHAVDVPTYVSFAPKRIENAFLGNQYLACFESCLTSACQDYMSPQSSPFPLETGDVCALFYEHSDYADSVSRKVRELRNDGDLWWSNRVGNATPGTKRGTAAIPLLQVADLGVFLGTKHITDSADTRIPWRPYYEKLYRAERVRMEKQLEFYGFPDE